MNTFSVKSVAVISILLGFVFLIISFVLYSEFDNWVWILGGVASLISMALMGMMAYLLAEIRDNTKKKEDKKQGIASFFDSSIEPNDDLYKKWKEDNPDKTLNDYYTYKIMNNK